MIILAKEEPLQDSDDLINLMIGLARGRGFDLRELAEKIQERLLADRPDHLLVVGEEAGLCKLIQMELSQALHWPVLTCSLEDLQAANNLLLGAQVVTPLIYHERVTALAPNSRPILHIRYQHANEHIERIRRLAEPSFIAVVSISERILLTAQSLFAPAIGHRHSMQGFLLPLESPEVLKAADVIICDSVAVRQIQSPRKSLYRLISPASLKEIVTAMGTTPKTAQSPASKKQTKKRPGRKTGPLSSSCSVREISRRWRE